MMREETVTPKKGSVSDVILVALIVFGTVLLRGLGGLLRTVHPFLDLAVQVLLFLAIVFAIYYIVTRRLVKFRYVLSDKRFVVYRAFGRQERLMEAVELSRIISICPYPDIKGEAGRENRLCPGNKTDATAVRYRLHGELNCLLIRPGETMLLELTSQWKAAGEAGAQ